MLSTALSSKSSKAFQSFSPPNAPKFSFPMCSFRVAMTPQFLFMGDKAKTHFTQALKEVSENEDFIIYLWFREFPKFKSNRKREEHYRKTLGSTKGLWKRCRSSSSCY
ncbi:hypothetical protein AVEN_155605-1 [Araneus ventricosus]|uniref:Uncharacterized protein n=1 Tax=Araneus ventricosus TaxID=182803 RepID=A0A4Y1ZTU9_ARAVE|nr:hypothetical protein AVEN_155605-1 [Araneus ventricosus]